MPQETSRLRNHHSPFSRHKIKRKDATIWVEKMEATGVYCRARTVQALLQYSTATASDLTKYRQKKYVAEVKTKQDSSLVLAEQVP